MSNVNAPYSCRKCPRLATFLDEQRTLRPDYFNGPVPNFYAPHPKLIVIGLAPGMHGANRTGRPFTGDWAGDLLYAAMDTYGFSSGQYNQTADDGLILNDAMITILLCLGKISHDSTVRALGLRLSAYKFGHGTEYTDPHGRTECLPLAYLLRHNYSVRVDYPRELYPLIQLFSYVRQLCSTF